MKLVKPDVIDQQLGKQQNELDDYIERLLNHINDNIEKQLYSIDKIEYNEENNSVTRAIKMSLSSRVLGTIPVNQAYQYIATSVKSYANEAGYDEVALRCGQSLIEEVTLTWTYYK